MEKELMNYYEVLGIDTHQRHLVTQKEIKERYRNLLLALHPDRGSPGADPERLIKVIEAYRVLSDPKCRDEYDKRLYDGDMTFEFDWKGAVLYLAECINVPINWDADIIVRVRWGMLKSKTITIQYTAWRHRVRGSVIAFDLVTQRITIFVDPTVDYTEEYLVVEGGGNDFILGQDLQMLHRGDLLIEIPQ